MIRFAFIILQTVDGHLRLRRQLQVQVDHPRIVRLKLDLHLPWAICPPSSVSVVQHRRLGFHDCENVVCEHQHGYHPKKNIQNTSIRRRELREEVSDCF